jgi:hypothetical protein
MLRLSVVCVAVAATAAGVGCGSSGRTELVPDNTASRRDDPLWYDQPSLLVPPGSGQQARRERERAQERERERRERDRLKVAKDEEKKESGVKPEFNRRMGEPPIERGPKAGPLPASRPTE